MQLHELKSRLFESVLNDVRHKNGVRIYRGLYFFCKSDLLIPKSFSSISILKDKLEFTISHSANLSGSNPIYIQIKSSKETLSLIQPRLEDIEVEDSTFMADLIRHEHEVLKQSPHIHSALKKL